MERTEYNIELVVNRRKITKVIIDQHYKENHSSSISDELILEVVKSIDGRYFQVAEEVGEFQYFKADPVYLDEKPYRLIFLLYLCEDILGVINCFRVPRSRDDK